MSDNLYNPSGGGASAITGIGAGNNKVFYSNGSGTITELALGADGTVLVGNGASAAPTFGNITDIKGGNDKLLYTNSSGVITELALGSSGLGLKSNGTTSAPSFAALGGNWSTVAAGTYSAGTATMFNLTSLSNYRALRGWVTIPMKDEGNNTVFSSMRINGKTATNYYYGRYAQASDGGSYSATGSWGGIFGGSASYYYGFGMFEIYALARGGDTTNQGVIAGKTNFFSRFAGNADAQTYGQFEENWFVYDEPLTSDTGITEFTYYMNESSSTIDVASGYNAYYVEGYTA